MNAPGLKIRMFRAARLLVVGFVLMRATTGAAETEAYFGPSALAVSKDGKSLYVTGADARQVVCVELTAGKITRRFHVPAEPTGLTLSPDGTRLVVTCAASKSTVLVIELPSWQIVATIRCGHTAVGPAITPDGKRLYVCNRFDNDVSVIDLAIGKELARAPATREPIAAAVTPDGNALFVANHLPNDRADAFPFAAAVTVIATATNRATSFLLPHGSHSARGVCISPDGKHAFVTHLLSNFELVPSQVDMGWMSSNVVSVIDVEQQKVLKTVGLDDSYKGAGNPWGVACTGDGKSVCVGQAGTHELSVVSTAAMLGTLVEIFTSPAVGAVQENASRGSSLWRINLPGKGPRAVAIIGAKVYVAEYFTDTVAVVDLERAAVEGVPATSHIKSPLPEGEGSGSKARATSNADTAPTVIRLGPKPQWSDRRWGELLFNDATICYQNWQSCASCHPDGRTDALNWDLTNDGIGNPKNTKSMVLAHQTPPAMGEGVRPSAEAAVRAGMENILFTERPDEELSAIDEYLRSLRPVPSPHLLDGRLSPSAERGKTLFESDRIGCHKCHPAPLYTDLGMHNVATRGAMDFADRFDTPTLVEVWRTAPYLHDGRYATVKELIAVGKHGRSIGRVEELSEQEMHDLVEFVLSL
jgi:YVTN family beta-propeller protein